MLGYLKPIEDESTRIPFEKSESDIMMIVGEDDRMHRSGEHANAAR